MPRAIAAGAEIRNLAMVGRVEMGTNGLATGVHYPREGRWRFQRARNVVAGYAIETPRLLLNSATDRFPQGLANSSGLVGKHLAVQASQAVWGTMEREVRSYKGPPSLAIAEHWNYDDNKDFPGGCCYMSQEPLPQLWASTQSSAHRLWGEALQAIDARDIWRQEDDTRHLNGGARMGDDPRESVVDADCRSWDVRNLWVCDGSVFPTVGGVNPSLTIALPALAMR